MTELGAECLPIHLVGLEGTSSTNGVGSEIKEKYASCVVPVVEAEDDGWGYGTVIDSGM